MPTSAAEPARPAAAVEKALPASTLRTTLLLSAAFILAAALRLDQFATQVVIDDEWHAVHRLLEWTPRRMLVDLYIADYSIPIGLYDWAIAHTVGLSELAMRAPMLAAGLALVAILPWAVVRPLGTPVAFAFALLLAASPMLLIYSQTARPYAITLLLGWLAHAAFQRFWRGSTLAGVAYAACATLATWMHPVIGPFVVAPFLWALWQLRSLPIDDRTGAFGRLCLLAAGTALPMLALLLPPLLMHPGALGAKSGFGLPALHTVIGALYWWLGTRNGWIVMAALALAGAGVAPVLRAVPEARTGAIGIAATLVVTLVVRPQFVEHVPTLGRYLLPVLPLLLLFVASGAVRSASSLPRAMRASGGQAGALVALSTILPAVALAATSPLPTWLAHPTSYRLAGHFHFEFRPEREAIALAYLDGIPRSPFWEELAKTPRGSLRIAAAPFYFESYYWAGHEWEARSGQRVIPGFLTGLCIPWRHGEVPGDRRFRIANAVHVADSAALARAKIDYVVWQKPYRHPSDVVPQPPSKETAHCEGVLRQRFPVVYEDGVLVVFRTPSSRAG